MYLEVDSPDTVYPHLRGFFPAAPFGLSAAMIFDLDVILWRSHDLLMMGGLYCQLLVALQPKVDDSGALRMSYKKLDNCEKLKEACPYMKNYLADLSQQH